MHWFLWFIILLVVGGVGYMIWTNRAQTIPGVATPSPNYPVIGHALQLLKRQDDFYDWLVELHQSRQFRGRSFVISLPATPPFLQPNPTEANCRHILKDKFENYTIGDYRRSVLGELFGSGIFGSDGDAWRTQRKSAANIFTLRLLRDDMTPVFVAHGNQLIRRLTKAAHSHTPVEMQDLFFRHTMSSFCQIAFGEDLHLLDRDEQHPFAKAFDLGQYLMCQRFLDPFFGWEKKFQMGGNEKEITKQVAIMNRYAYEFVAHRREDIKNGKERTDLISHFMAQARKDGVEMTDQQLRDVIINFLVAGRDTTAVTLSWFLKEMIARPAILAKVRAEIETLLPNSSTPGQPDFQMATEMSYTEAALLESLRLNPSVPSDDRTALKDDTLPDGTRVVAGTMVAFNAYVYGRSEELWGADVLDFKPERWLDQDGKVAASSGDDAKSSGGGGAGGAGGGAGGSFDGAATNLRKFSQYKYPTFSGGLRLCMGRGLALQEAKLAIAQLFHAFDFELVPNQQITYIMTVCVGVYAMLEPSRSSETRDFLALTF